MDIILQCAPVSVKEAMGNYTTDVIACCGFGIESNSLKNPDAEFRRYLRRVFDYSLRKGLFSITVFLAPHLQNFLKLRLADEATTKFLREVTWSTVAYRQQYVSFNQVKSKPFTVTSGVSQGSNLEIDGDDFVAQCFIFMAAGFETTSSTMSFLLYELALQPELQHRLRVEMGTVLAKHRGEITYDAIQEMTYLDMVLSGQNAQHSINRSKYCNPNEHLGEALHLWPIRTKLFIQNRDSNRTVAGRCCSCDVRASQIARAWESEQLSRINVSTHQRSGVSAAVERAC
ncbi:hypothetical protein ANN_27319 [Periplaneta americana]|uniref:Cytochrome P450 n=1 Tax=Periplaneta americana TaxID=6978 RepID=A0ABQ8RXV6_PERAM|nr:hypothetical protein ANN_27319 [Periplaneta americana]